MKTKGILAIKGGGGIAFNIVSASWKAA